MFQNSRETIRMQPDRELAFEYKKLFMSVIFMVVNFPVQHQRGYQT